MIYLSQIVNKNVYFQKKKYGKIIDASVFENHPQPSLSKVVIKIGSRKITVPPNSIEFHTRGAILKTTDFPILPYDTKDFYLNEDLLDKQVIDIDGKRLVRVNDVLLERNGEIKVIGIDIGLAGLLRRLHLGKLIKAESKILPWQMIEAFDYETGNIKIKVTQTRLNTFHPSELADILEEAGTKERLGIVESLDTEKAAEAIEEAEEHTQEAILEQLPPSFLEKVVNRMRVSEIADIFYKLNPLRLAEILKLLGGEKAATVERLVKFPQDTAGGLMILNFLSIDGNKTVKELMSELSTEEIKPEAIIITNGAERFVGVTYIKDLIDKDPLAQLKDIVSERKFTYPYVDFKKILEIFTHYNLRVLPVVDREKKPIGIITIDSILARIEEESAEYEGI
ncbi:MAG: hypothetical protein A2W22_00270 [Candidatus Levybacteria bacterium RBG_16_35_11]|nr:MAG: hypothetical protein A2W22_00270 [Candidatus Levybacteria bacterium RBG_16_35_11]